MADESVADGASASNKDNASFAEKLQKKHAENHNPTVEEVEDEEDRLHPPPSSNIAKTAPSTETEEPPLSERAKGKQKADEAPEDHGSQEVQPKVQTLDTQSEELFPALGSGPKPRAGAVPAAWGSKRPASVASKVNGMNGSRPGSSGPTSRASTPASGILSSTTNAQPRIVDLPNKYSETLNFTREQLVPRNKLNKPIPDLIRDINRKSKATVEMKHLMDGGLAFQATAPGKDAGRAPVHEALREIAKQVTAKHTVRLPVPASARPHIIGKSGSTVNNIIQKSGAFVQLPKAEEGPKGFDGDDDATIDVVIEGNAVSAAQAKDMILSIVKERVGTMSTRLREIPAELYPFLAGPFNSGLESFTQGGDVQIKVPPYHAWSRQGPPKFEEQTQTPVLTPHPSSHIQLSGDREAVQRARADIERQANALQQQLAMKQLEIDRNRHQFIHGDNDAHHNFLEQTGCYVILPSDDDDTEMVTLVGPQERLADAESTVIDLAHSMQNQLIDIARLHGNAPQGGQAHARAVTNYLRQRQAIRQIEDMYNSRIVLPTAADGPTNWEVFAKDGAAIYRAKSDITNIINAHPPSRFRHVDVDPFYHRHLRETYQDRFRQQHGVHLVLPDEEEDEPQVTIVYEGLSPSGTPYEVPRQRPTPADVARFEEALLGVQQMIQEIAAGQQPIESRPVDVPPKFHDKVHRHVRQQQGDLPDGIFPIQFLAPSGQSRGPILRGPNDRLDPLVGSIRAFVEAEKRDELERSHVTSFDFPKKHANFLIGKRGENINKLREEFDVDIQLNEGKVDIVGPPHKADKAKAHIMAMSKKLDDEATHVLKIHPQYHREMIGARGSQVNRLQDRYGVRVQFPRSATNGHDDEGSVANGSENGSPRNVRSNQGPDEVIVRGPRKGADAAKEELESLLKWTMDNSHSATVSVAQSQLPSLIGTGGREMENIRQTTGAKIDVPGSREVATPSGRVELRLKGTKKQVDDAKALLQQRAKVFDESTSRVMEVDKRHHGAIIGPQGSNLRRIVLAAGGPQNERDQNRIIKVPKSGSGETAIRLEGNKVVVDKIVAEIQKIVSERESQDRQRESHETDVFELSPEKHRRLIGRNGDTRRKLESELGVLIDIPREDTQGPARSQIKLSGPADKLQPAKDHLSSLFKESEGENIQVPLALHHVIADNGRFFARLRKDHGVIVDHGGQQPPPKSATKSGGARNGDAPLPLITDEDAGGEGYSWDLVEGPGVSSDLEGLIPWILRPASASSNISSAKSSIESALESAKTPSCTGYLALPDPSSYGLVIGTGGANINSIRRETGCAINVPRSRGRTDPIEIVGSKDEVERARDLILDSIKGRY